MDEIEKRLSTAEYEIILKLKSIKAITGRRFNVELGIEKSILHDLDNNKKIIFNFPRDLSTYVDGMYYILK